jgi:hypothetical protein
MDAGAIFEHDPSRWWKRLSRDARHDSPNVVGVRVRRDPRRQIPVDEVLGVGGMGVVVGRIHLDLDERVAIKFLLPEVLDHGRRSARFAREARAAVKIKSEHVAR